MVRTDTGQTPRRRLSMACHQEATNRARPGRAFTPPDRLHECCPGAFGGYAGTPVLLCECPGHER